MQNTHRMHRGFPQSAHLKTALTVAFANQHPSPIGSVPLSPTRGNTHRNWLAPLTRAFRSVLNLWFCIRQHHCRFEQNGPADSYLPLNPPSQVHARFVQWFRSEERRVGKE